MKIRTMALAMLAFSTLAHANESLLTRALTCQLKPAEVKGLMGNLKTAMPEFGSPTREYALPTMNLYKLNQPITALGYTSSSVIILPGRVLMVVDGQTLNKVVAEQQLTPADLTPASREVNSEMFTVAYQVGEKSLAQKILVGCEYRMREASWQMDDSFNDLMNLK